MNALLEWLGGENQVGLVLTAGVLVAARIFPLAFLAPWLGLRSAPALLRTAVVLALTVSLTSTALLSATELPRTEIALALALVREAMLGSLLAFATALPLHALDWTGRLVDLWRGANLAEVIAPPTGERTSPMGDLLLMMGVSFFLLLGGHRVAIGLLAESFILHPVGAAASPANLSMGLMGAARLTTDALRFAVVLAAPVGTAVVLTEIALGLVARAAPQVPVFFAGMPLRALVGILATLAALSVVVGRLPEAYRDVIRAAEWMIRSLR